MGKRFFPDGWIFFEYFNIMEDSKIRINVEKEAVNISEPDFRS